MDGSRNGSLILDEGGIARRHSSIHVFTLKDFVAKYRKSFPLRIRIEDGEYSSDPDESFSSGDIFWLHSVKGTASVLIRDAEHDGSNDITVPVANSSVEYGLVYSAAEGELTGSIFKTVGDIMATKPLPKMVCATKSHQTSKPNCSSVSASEILVIQEVKRVRISGYRLKVYSITEGVAKLLSSDCSAYFSTQPALTKISMHMLLKCAKIEFPVRACVFSAGSEDINATRIPVSLLNRVVILQAIVEGAQSILATNYVAGCTPTFVRPPSDYLHLPVDLPISISLYREDDDAGIVSRAAESVVKVVYDCTYDVPPQRVQQNVQETKVKLEVEEKQIEDERLSLPQATLMSLKEDLEVEFARSMNKIVSSPDEHVRHDSATLANSSSGSEILYARLKTVVKEQSEGSHYDIPSRTKPQAQHQVIVEHTYSNLKEKKVILDGLTVEQVCELLVNLGMGKHCKTFQKEKINGNVLLFCTEDVLRNELHISAAEERKKLLDIIKESNRNITSDK